MDIAVNILTGAERTHGDSVISSLYKAYASKFSCAKTARSALIIGVAFAILQVLDGLLTSIGIHRYGIEIEGNPFLKAMMIQFGYIQVLTFMKAGTIATIAFLTVMSARVTWIKGALTSLSAIYLLGAIIPWAYVLFIQPVA